jgi:FkbM family methyltransferase
MNKIQKLLSLEKSNHDPINNFSNIVNNKKIVIYGAGSGYITFSMFVLQKYSYTADLIIDNKFIKGEKQNGIDTTTIENIKTDNSILKNSVVIITLGNISLYNEIFEKLKSKGFNHIISAFDVYEYHLSHSSKELNVVGIEYYSKSIESIQLAHDALSDEKSKNIFIAILKLYVTKNIIKINSDGIKNQYLPDDIHLSKGYSRLINCGSYDGDTIRSIFDKKGKFESILCFEPDLANFEKLTNYLNTNKNHLADSILALPLGVYNKNCLMLFNGNNQTNSTINNQKDMYAKDNEAIVCVKIDSLAVNFKPTMINMDVEGAEMLALEGAKETIICYRPDLAVSVYHEIKHLWEIINYISSLNLGYKFYLRNYTGFPAETVLYATE